MASKQPRDSFGQGIAWAVRSPPAAAPAASCGHARDYLDRGRDDHLVGTIHHGDRPPGVEYGATRARWKREESRRGRSRSSLHSTRCTHSPSTQTSLESSPPLNWAGFQLQRFVKQVPVSCHPYSRVEQPCRRDGPTRRSDAAAWIKCATRACPVSGIGKRHRSGVKWGRQTAVPSSCIANRSAQRWSRPRIGAKNPPRATSTTSGNRRCAPNTQEPRHVARLPRFRVSPD